MDRQSIIAYGEPLQATSAETPTPTGEQVLVAIRHCGVCHSDIHMHDGFFDLGGGKQLDVRGGRQLPFTLGHEIEGEVIAVGDKVRGVEVGERRVVYPWIGCGACEVCLHGEEIYCNRPRHFGITVDGGFATHVLVPHSRYLLDASGIDPVLAGTYMCSGLTAYSALKKLGRRAGKGPVLIVGLGGVGMMAVEFAKEMFDTAPYVADIDEAKRRTALARGAQGAFDPADPAARKELIKASGGGVAAAADFAGAEASANFAQGALRKGGKLVIAGLIGGTFSLPLPMFPLRAIAIEGSFVGSLAEAKEMLDLVRTRGIEPIPLDMRPLDAANASLDDLRAGRVVGRIVLTP